MQSGLKTAVVGRTHMLCWRFLSNFKRRHWYDGGDTNTMSSGLRCCPVDTPALKLMGVLGQQLRISHTIVRGTCIEHIPAAHKQQQQQQQQQQQTGMVSSTQAVRWHVNSSTSSFLLHLILPVHKAAQPVTPACIDTAAA
jgi:hypothetical protein